MKKVFLLMAVALVSLTASAQFYAGGSLGFWNDDDADETAFFIAPEVGYNLNEKWSVGLELGYFNEDAVGVATFAASPYARYTYFNQDRLSLFVDGGFGFSYKDQDNDETGFNIGLQPGVAVSLTEKFSLVAKFGFLGYNDKYLNAKDGFGLNLTNNISFGFYVNF
ncbi:hypothetical protein M2138_001545 [Dysgonomonadaceae bacterium PH5-43]|nr:hypothetical protein [Dysgonomonadaceae bacterium PH5-43]